MLNMTVLRLRRVGNSLGIILPKELVEQKGLRADDPVRIEVERAARLHDVLGSLRHHPMSIRELNDLTNEGEDV